MSPLHASGFSGSLQLDKQRAYLGGDATHSILVKGLDYALLARRKAELKAQGEQVADDELDALVSKVKEDKAPKAPKEEKSDKSIGKGVSE